jgi:hypothetical protein
MVDIVIGVVGCLVAGILCAYVCSRYLEVRALPKQMERRHIEIGKGLKFPVLRRYWIGGYFVWKIDWVGSEKKRKKKTK